VFFFNTVHQFNDFAPLYPFNTVIAFRFFSHVTGPSVGLELFYIYTLLICAENLKAGGEQSVLPPILVIGNNWVCLHPD